MICLGLSVKRKTQAFIFNSFFIMSHSTLLSCLESKRIDSTKIYARFALGNFLQGQGLTVANTLRRALLSQIPGAAICFAEIAGTKHEYDRLPGVRDCVLDILLHLRRITLASDIDLFQTQVAYISVKGPGVVRARDLNLPSFLKVVHPNQYITTLNKKGHLNIKLLITCGKTYLTHTPGSPQYESHLLALKKRSWHGFQDTWDSQEENMRDWKNERRRLKKKQNKQTTTPLITRKLKAKGKNVAVQPLTNIKRTIWNPQNIQRLGNLKATEDPVLKQVPKQNKELFELAPLPKLTVQQKEQILVKASEIGDNGYFPIDSVFAPVVKVTYSVEAVSKTAEKIYLEIWTNGAIDPRYAIHKAVIGIIDLFLPLQSKSLNPLPSLTNWFKTGASNQEIKDVTGSVNKKKARKINASTTNRQTAGSLEGLKNIDTFYHNLARVNVRKQTVEQLNPEARAQLLWLKRTIQEEPTLLVQVWRCIFQPKKTRLSLPVGILGAGDEMEIYKPMSAKENILSQTDSQELPSDEDYRIFTASLTPKQKSILLLKNTLMTKKGMRNKRELAVGALRQISKDPAHQRPSLPEVRSWGPWSQPDLRKLAFAPELVSLKRRDIAQLKFYTTILILRDFLFQVSLTDLQLPIRVHAPLIENNIETIGQLVRTSKEQLLQFPSLTPQDIQKLKLRLKDFAFAFLMIDSVDSKAS